MPWVFPSLFEVFLQISFTTTLIAHESPEGADADSVDLKNLPIVLAHRLHFKTQGSNRIQRNHS